jgi:predicted nucleic acid-binding protein
LSNPTQSGEPKAIRDWAEARLLDGATIVIPEIADYEVRRELIRAGKTFGIIRLDVLGRGLAYEPLRTPQLRRAAQLWAEARSRGKPTAHDAALDGDIILAAQTLHLMNTDGDTVVATTNPKRLAMFVPARRWRDV